MHAEPLARQQTLGLMIADDAPLPSWDGVWLRARTHVRRGLHAVALHSR